jgi:hypothetical protein
VGAFIKTRRIFYRYRITSLLGAALLCPLAAHAQSDWCRCPGGAVFQPGLVHYGENSDRELVTRIEVNKGDPDRRCEAAWINYSEVFTKGTPYGFHLQRKHLKTIREDACGESPKLFVSRTKTYSFVPDADSQAVRELYPIVGETARLRPDLAPGQKSNANVWDSIATTDPVETRRTAKPAAPAVSAPEFVRTAWVLARRDVKGHYVGLVRGIDQRESIQTLKGTRSVPAGEVGQIEASNGHTAIVRFYAGSRTEKLAGKKNALRRWYDNVGGPYTETKDDLFSPLRAYIVEVPLEDIIEVNDHLDAQKTDET